MKGTGYLIQAALISFWWTSMFFSQDIFQAFQFEGIGKSAFTSFLIPDLIVIVLLSIIRAYRKNKDVELVILGGFLFGTLYCVNATILTKSGYLATTTMILGLSFNIFLIYNQHLFKTATTSSLMMNGFKTMVQIICVWTITLTILPAIIINEFQIDNIKIDSFYLTIGIILFLGFSLLGLWSAYAIVTLGKGTPLPIDQTQKLVTDGPYR